MKPAILSTETRLRAALDAAGMPVPQFVRVARLDGLSISKSRLYAAFEDRMMSLDTLEGQRLMKLWNEIAELGASLRPMHLDLSDGERVYQCLKLKRAGRWVMLVVPSSDEVDQ
jgi:hypothetical protein